MRMHSQRHDSQVSSKAPRTSGRSDLGIVKPPFLTETCPVEIQQNFPNTEKTQKQSKCNRNVHHVYKELSKTSTKPNVSLPKLKMKEVSQQRIDAGEPYEVQLVLPKFTSRQEKPTNDFQKARESATSVRDDEYFENSLFRNIKGSSHPGPSECLCSFSVPDSELKIDDFDIEEEKMEESKALKRWEFWMRDKIRQQNNLANRLGIDSCKLQMQESDKYRQVTEDKLLLTYAQLPNADKWRGHPYRWKPKAKLGEKKKGQNSENQAQYTATKTTVQEGKTPEIEFVGIPKAIQLEKGLKMKTRKKPKKFSYQDERFLHFRDQIKKLKPHDIKMDQLAVIGKSVIPPQKEENEDSISLQTIPEIIIETEDEQNCADYRQSIFCLAIDGEEVKYELEAGGCQNPDKSFTWLIDFGVNTVGSLVERVLRIENRGTVAIRYSWVSHKYEQKQSLDLLQEKHHQPWFFFNKNSGFFLPGQIYDLKFYSQADTYGIKKETWLLNTTPPLSTNSENATIILSAIATDDSSDERNDLELYLRMRVQDTIVYYILELILYKVFNSVKDLREVEYRSIFLEKELFEYRNSKYYYHSSVLRELHAVFEQIPHKTQKEWDLSLDSLVSLIQTFSKGKEKDSLFFTVVASAKKLLRPTYLSVKKSKKYKMSYEILCKMTNFMEEDYEYIRNLVSQKKEKSGSDCRVFEEFTSSSSFMTEDMGEIESNSAMALLEIKPVNYIFFQTMLYFKVYHRLCEAVDQIVGILETAKLLEPWKQVNYKPEKPSRIKRW